MTAPFVSPPFVSPFPGPDYAYDPRSVNLNFGAVGPTPLQTGLFNQGVMLNGGTNPVNPANAQAVANAQAAAGNSVPSSRFDQLLQRGENAIQNVKTGFNQSSMNRDPVTGALAQGPVQAAAGRAQQLGQLSGRGLNALGGLGTNRVAAGLTAFTAGSLANDSLPANLAGTGAAILASPIASKVGGVIASAVPGGRIIAPLVQAAVPIAAAALGSGAVDQVGRLFSSKNGANPVTEAVTGSVDRAINPGNLDNRSKAAGDLIVERFNQLKGAYGEEVAKMIALQEAGLLNASEVQKDQEKNRADLATIYRSRMIPVETAADISRTYATGLTNLSNTVATALGNLGTTALSAQSNPYLNSRG